MGNLNCAGKGGKAKKQQLKDAVNKKASDAVDGVADKLSSLPNGDSNEAPAQATDEPTEPNNVPEIVSVWVCENLNQGQRTKIDLGASPTLHTLLNEIQYKFSTYTPESTLELLNEDETWSEISVANPNVPLSDAGINSNSLVSIKPKQVVPEPKPVAEPAPEPVAEPVPAPVNEPASEPVTESEPAPAPSDTVTTN